MALTDLNEYISPLIKRGYKVIKLPRAQGKYASYLNSALVNNIAFVPTFGIKEDIQALTIYKSLGFKVVEINAKEIISGMGAIHCITQTYPKLTKGQIHHLFL